MGGWMEKIGKNFCILLDDEPPIECTELYNEVGLVLYEIHHFFSSSTSSSSLVINLLLFFDRIYSFFLNKMGSW